MVPNSFVSSAFNVDQSTYLKLHLKKKKQPFRVICGNKEIIENKMEIN